MEDLHTKEKILKGAENLFLKYGVRSISMDDIARHLAVSKKTLYQHFADKEDMVTTVCVLHMESNRKEFDAIRESSANAIDELARISICLKRNMEETNPSLMFDLQKFHPKAWAAWIEFKKNVIYESVKQNLEQGIQEGYYRPEINTEILSVARYALIEIAFADKDFPHNRFNIAEVQIQLFEQFVYGIVTEKGKKLYQKYKEQNLQPSIL